MTDKAHEIRARIADHAEKLAALMRSPEPGVGSWSGWVGAHTRAIVDWWQGRWALGMPELLPVAEQTWPAPVPTSERLPPRDTDPELSELSVDVLAWNGDEWVISHYHFGATCFDSAAWGWQREVMYWLPLPPAPPALTQRSPAPPHGWGEDAADMVGR